MDQKKASVSGLCKLGWRRLREEVGKGEGRRGGKKEERKVVRKAGKRKRKENKKSMGVHWGSNPGPQQPVIASRPQSGR